MWERNIHQLPPIRSYQGPEPQPRQVPWPGIKPTIFWFTVWRSNHLSHTSQGFTTFLAISLCFSRKVRVNENLSIWNSEIVRCQMTWGLDTVSLFLFLTEILVSAWGSTVTSETHGQSDLSWYLCQTDEIMKGSTFLLQGPSFNWVFTWSRTVQASCNWARRVHSLAWLSVITDFLQVTLLGSITV